MTISILALKGKLNWKILLLRFFFCPVYLDPLLYCFYITGGGINERNLGRILSESHATEFHCSARSSVPSKMSFRRDGVTMGATFGPPEYSVKATDRDKVQRLVARATDVWDLET